MFVLANFYLLVELSNQGIRSRLRISDLINFKLKFFFWLYYRFDGSLWDYCT